MTRFVIRKKHDDLITNKPFFSLRGMNLAQTRYSIDKHRHSLLSRRAKRNVKKKCDDGNIMQIVIWARKEERKHKRNTIFRRVLTVI